jgi:hypothetical protein
VQSEAVYRETVAKTKGGCVLQESHREAEAVCKERPRLCAKRGRGCVQRDPVGKRLSARELILAMAGLWAPDLGGDRSLGARFPKAGFRSNSVSWENLGWMGDGGVGWPTSETALSNSPSL